MANKRKSSPLNGEKTLGEKIKELRLKAGLTQAELCKDFITRNMLSLIENDLAIPSGKTLSFLSERLDVSPAYFFESEDDPFIYRKNRIIDSVRASLNGGEYEKCKELCLSLEGTDDEIAYILTYCFYKTGVSKWNLGFFDSAERHFERACLYAESTCYDTKSIISDIEICRFLSSAALGADSRPTFPINKNGEREKRLEFDLYTYMLRVTDTCRYDLAARIYDTMKFIENELYKLHINARLSIAAQNYKRAISLLGEIVSLFDEKEADFALRLTVVHDLENACKAISDYEGAYKCAIMREGLLQGK